MHALWSCLELSSGCCFLSGLITVCLVFLEALQSKGSCCAEFSPGYCLLEIPDILAVLMLRNCSVCRNSLLKMCYSVDHSTQSMSDVWKCQVCHVCPDSVPGTCSVAGSLWKPYIYPVCPMKFHLESRGPLGPSSLLRGKHVLCACTSSKAFLPCKCGNWWILKLMF